MKRITFEELILHEDDNLLVINKPAHISSLQERWAKVDTIHEMAKEYHPEAQLCHRLDKETSGLLLISKKPEIYREVAKGFTKRLIKKTYLAIQEGRHYFRDFEVDVPLAVTARGRAKVDRHAGKPATTFLTAIENFRHFTLAECRPISGRLHQIRIHSSIQNAPISGDTAYGGTLPYLSAIKKNFNYSKDRNPRPMIERVALHAKQLEFTVANTYYNVEAPLPKDFSVMLTLLRKYDNA